MPEIERLDGRTSWVDLDFVERERTPREIVEVGIQLHVAGLSLANTKQILDTLGVERSRTAIHNWVQKADVQPDSDAEPNHIAVNETVIQVNDQRHWLYAAVDPTTNEILHVRLFQTRTTQLTLLFLRELQQKQQVEQATFLIDGATHLASALDRLSLDVRYEKHGNRNSVKRIFREVKRRTSSFRIRSATPRSVQQNRGWKPSPSGGIDAKLNTTVWHSPESSCSTARAGRSTRESRETANPNIPTLGIPPALAGGGCQRMI